MIKKERFFAVQRVLKFVALLALAMPLALASCSSSSDSDDEEELGEDYDPDAYRLAKNVCNVANDVAEIYMDCNSIEELKEYAGDIKKMRNVEDVYFSSTTMFVKIKGYGPIMYSFFPDPEPIDIDNLMDQTARTRVSHPTLGLKTAVVVNQIQLDERYNKTRFASKLVLDLFNDHGIEALPKDDAGLKFYNEEIFKYDLIYIMTHGSYDPNVKLHFLTTTDSPSEKATAELNPDFYYGYSDYSTNDVRLSMHKEMRGGKEVGIWYLSVSEHYINSSDFSFKNPSIVYCGACQTMKGSGTPTENPTDTISRSMAEVFVGKGASLYVGYDESNTIGERVGLYFYQRLLSGMSLKNGYEDLPFWCKHEFCQNKKEVDGEIIEVSHWADLIIHYNKSEDSRIKKPQLEKWVDLSTNDDIKIVLKAKSIFHFTQMYYNDETNSWLTSSYNDEMDFKYGFIISDNEGFGNSKLLKRMNIGDPGCKINAKNEVEFELTLTKDDLQPSTTYYYMAFLLDGYDYYFSDPDSFTTKDLPVDTGTQLPDVPGTDF